VGEHLGRRTRTLSDPETTAHVAALRDQQRQFVHLLQLATSLTTQLQHVVQTQRCLGDALSELSQSGGDVPLGEQFSSSSDTLKLISKNGETLLSMSSNLLWQHSIREHSQNVKVAPKNWHHFLYALTLPNINQCSKLFHCRNQEKICNNTITEDPTTPQVCCYTTL